MGSLNAKTTSGVPDSENRRAGNGRIPEIHEMQPAGETPPDGSQKTTYIRCMEDGPQPPTEEGHEGHIRVVCEEMEGQAPPEASRVVSETPSLAGTSRSSEVACGVSEEGEMTPGLMELIGKLVESDGPSSIDILCQPGQEGDGSGDSASRDYDLCTPLVSEPGTRCSEEPSQAVLQLPDSWDVVDAVKPLPDAPVTETIAARVAGLVAWRPSPGSVAFSDAAAQTGPAGESPEASAGMTVKEAEISAFSWPLGTPV
ncbi:uncharacterized protein LOC143830830 [Paroedura picta]|uniref:uncharacterized protein LOC143830830 n=1 Tax=Paroedura picta TaxID=143630 RepID=UPI004057832D